MSDNESGFQSYIDVIAGILNDPKADYDDVNSPASILLNKLIGRQKMNTRRDANNPDTPYLIPPAPKTMPPTDDSDIPGAYRRNFEPLPRAKIGPPKIRRTSDFSSDTVNSDAASPATGNMFDDIDPKMQYSATPNMFDDMPDVAPTAQTPPSASVN